MRMTLIEQYPLYFLIVVDCGTLPDPVYGQVSHMAKTTLGQTATYSCNPGYKLVGDNIRICHASGDWSGSAPTCQRMLDYYIFIFIRFY